MSDLGIAMVAFAAVIIVVTVCATIRPGAAQSMTTALYALAAVFTAIWPWSRRP